MWTGHSTLITLYTVINLPFWNVYGNITLFISSGSLWEMAVFTPDKSTYRQVISFLSVHRLHYFINKFRFILFSSNCCFITCLSPFSRHLYLYQGIGGFINSIIIHLYYLISLMSVSFLNSILEILNSIIKGDNLCQFEKGGLHNHIDPATKTYFLSNLNSINNIEAYIMLSQIFLNTSREFFFQLFFVPGAVKNKITTIFQPVNQVKLVNI